MSGAPPVVCTIGQMASASYYINSQRSQRHPTDYYAKPGEEPDGVWWNPDGLFDLPDGEKVDATTFRSLCDGYSPTDGAPLTKLAGSARRRAGFDVTFSADKSISALWALADPELRAEIERAHNDAAREALRSTIRRYCSFTRRRPGEVLEVVPGRIFGAMWQHGTSRELDPQLHTHCTILNLVRTDADKKWRALHGHPIYRWQLAAGASYRAVLATHLSQRLGIRMERHGRGGALSRIVGMPPALIDRWSKRRATIEELARARGVNASNGAAMQQIIMETRASKSGDRLSEARHIRWALEATETIQQDIKAFIAGLIGHDVRVDPERDAALRHEISEIPMGITRHDAVFNLARLIERVAHVGAGFFESGQDIHREVKGLMRGKRVVKLDRVPRTPEGIAGMAHTKQLSTTAMVEAEATVRDIAAFLAHVRGHEVPADRVSGHVDKLIEKNYPLSSEQVTAIHYATSRGGGISVIEGAAGAGKSTTLRPIADLHRAMGRKIVPIAVAWAVATPLGVDVEAKPYSVKMMFAALRRKELEIDRDTVIIVDEAGMLPTHETLRLLELVERTGAKLIAVGDTKQQQPVEAGPGLRLITEQVGSVRIDSIRRQLPDAEDVLRHVHGMDVETARLKQAMMSPTERRQIVADYQAMDNPPEFQPWQIAASEAFRDGDAATGIAALQERGRFHVLRDPETTLKRIAADWAHWQTENPGRTSIVLARTHDETRALSHYIREHVLAGNADAEGVNIEAWQGNDRNPSTLNIRVGDRLRIGTTLWADQLFNGTVVTVEGYRVKPGRGNNPPTVTLDLRTEDGRQVTIDHDRIVDRDFRVRLGHGYAVTFASAQGRTVDRAWALIDEAPSAETVYPVVTRHREALDIYVVGGPVLETIRQFSPEDQVDRPLTLADVPDHLAMCWSRSHPKEAAHDHMTGEQAEQHARTAAGVRRRAFAPIFRNVSEHSTRRTHRHRIASLATAVADLDRNWADLRGRYRADGDAVVMSEAWREAHGRQRILIDRVRAIHDGGGTVSVMLGEAGVDREALGALEVSYRKRTRLQQSVAARHRKSGTQPAPDRARGGATAAARDKARGVVAAPAAGGVPSHQDPTMEASMAVPVASHDVMPTPAKPVTETPSAAPASTEARPRSDERHQAPVPPRLRAGDLSARLAEQAEAVCRHYLPNGLRQSGYWSIGGLSGEAGKSMWVHISGDRRGRWTDGATGESGDMLDLIKGVVGGETRAAMAEAARFLGHTAEPLAPRPAAAPSASPPQPKQDPKIWQDIYSQAKPIADDDAAARYLASRGLGHVNAPGLRFDPNSPVTVNNVRQRHPAILAPMTTPDGDLRTLYAIFLTADGQKAGFDGGKRFRSSPEDAAMWLGDARTASRVFLTEGVEDAIAAWSALSVDERQHTAVAAAGGTRFHRLTLPEGCRDVVLLQDRDEAGERAWTAMQRQFAERPVALSRVVPTEKDINAELIHGGEAAVRRILAPALRDRQAAAAETPAAPAQQTKPPVEQPDAAPKTVPTAQTKPPAEPASGGLTAAELEAILDKALSGFDILKRGTEARAAADAEARNAAARAREADTARWQYGSPVAPEVAREAARVAERMEQHRVHAAVAFAGPGEGERIDAIAVRAALRTLRRAEHRIFPIETGRREIDDVLLDWAAQHKSRILTNIRPETVPHLPLHAVVDLATPASEAAAVDLMLRAAQRRIPVISVDTADTVDIRVIRRERIDTPWQAAADPHADPGTPEGELRVLFARVSNYRDAAYGRRALPTEIDGYTSDVSRLFDLTKNGGAIGEKYLAAASAVLDANRVAVRRGLEGFLDTESTVSQRIVKRFDLRLTAPAQGLTTGMSRGRSM